MMKEALVSSAERDSQGLSLVNRRPLLPSFWGLVRAELLKLSRQWTTWILLVLVLCFVAGIYVIELTIPSLKDEVQRDPLHYLAMQLRGLDILRVFAGIFLIVVAARCVGLEYQLGTIRILLARGVGRLQLLGAKLLALVLVGIAMLALGLAEVAICSCLLMLLQAGNLNALSAADATFWHDAGLYTLAVASSMGISLLMAVALAVVGRSQTFGLSAALGYFPADNFLVFLLYLGFRLTNNQFWQDVSAYLLGPNLNVMGSVVTAGRLPSTGTQPLNMHLVDARHIWLLLLVYALVFLLIAVVLTRSRDVKE
ncbi:ABC transporter permease [Thermogemmatispora onikobensis]|uniref:ABC transporter permease n=1 Tax=Thermogemmatispora onikobensis TaxID=732234 RepID=UPI000852CF99|nr:ABC transporter permease [Thermogemmatispora onikobensis]